MRFKLAILLLAVAAALSLPGCSSISALTGPSAENSPTVESVPKGTETKIRAGDEIAIRITGTSTTLDNAYAQAISDAGDISLPYIDQMKALDKTPEGLAADIKKAYIDGGYFRIINVTVSLKDRYFYIRGEVRSSGRYLWTSDMTILKAITTAGGFTDFANARDVRVDRRGQILSVNCKLAYSDPKYDIPILPSDSVTVPRSIF